MIITGIGPLALTGKISASSGTRVGRLMPDGATIYDARTTETFTSVTLNGISMTDKGILEVKIWPSGYGYIMSIIDTTSETISFPDGSYATYVNYGVIEIL